MKQELRIYRLPFWLLWSLGIGLLTVGFCVWYWTIDTNDVKLLGFVGGVAAGLFVYFLTYLTVLPPIMQLDGFRRMGIKALLANRHDKIYYSKLVGESRLRVDVMGASCNRFVRDFLDVESDEKVLIDALSKHRNLKVRILIPDDEHMDEESKDRTASTISQIGAVQRIFPNRVELRRFDDEARHSFLICDNDVVAGPIFADGQSRHAPAVHVTAETLFGQKYSAYFDAEWNRSSAQ